MKTRGKLLATEPTSHLNNLDPYRHRVLAPLDLSESVPREGTQGLEKVLPVGSVFDQVLLRLFQCSLYAYSVTNRF